METFAEKVARLQREIGERQAELAHLILGDQTKCVSASDSSPIFNSLTPAQQQHYLFMGFDPDNPDVPLD